MLWGERRGAGIIVARQTRRSAPMPQLNDQSRSHTALKQDSTLIAVLEMSQSAWLVAGLVPGRAGPFPLPDPPSVSRDELGPQHAVQLVWGRDPRQAGDRGRHPLLAFVLIRAGEPEGGC